MLMSEIASKNRAVPQSVLVYGAPKSGKTALIGQLAKKYKLLWLDCEQGYQTLFNTLDEQYWANVNIISIEDTLETPNAIRTIGKLFNSDSEHSICEAHGKLSCAKCSAAKLPINKYNLYQLNTDWVVVVDSLSQLSDSALHHVLGGLAFDQSKDTTFKHWNNQGLLLKNILNNLKKIPAHKVFISHEEELEQEDGTSKVCPVAGTRNFSRRVGRFFDHVIYMEIKNKTHRANSGSVTSAKFQSGSRNNRSLENSDDICDIFQAKKLDMDSAKSLGLSKKLIGNLKPGTGKTL